MTHEFWTVRSERDVIFVSCWKCLRMSFVQNATLGEMGLAHLLPHAWKDNDRVAPLSECEPLGHTFEEFLDEMRQAVRFRREL